MKKLMFCIVVASSAIGIAGPHGCPPGPRPYPPTPPPHHGPYYGGSWQGRGGCNFWPAFTGAAVGTIVGNSLSRPASVTVVQQPVVVQPAPVVQQPVIIQSVNAPKQVWVEGKYVDTVQANGTIIRVWQPGHWVTVQ